jgi:hypothetical protein
MRKRDRDRRRQRETEGDRERREREIGISTAGALRQLGVPNWLLHNQKNGSGESKSDGTGNTTNTTKALIVFHYPLRIPTKTHAIKTHSPFTRASKPSRKSLE